MPLILKYFMTSHDNWNYQRKKIYSVTHLCCKISLYFSRSKGDYVLQNYETVPKKLNIFMKLSISVTFYCTHPRPFCRFTPCHAELTCSHIGVRAQSTLGAQHFCPKNMYEKITKCPNFTWFLPEKLSEYPKFYDICPKNAHIFHNNCPKNIFPNFRGGGHMSPLSPVSYAYLLASETTAVRRFNEYSTIMWRWW